MIVENNPSDEDSTTNDANSKNDQNENDIESRSVSETSTATETSQERVVKCQDYGEFWRKIIIFKFKFIGTLGVQINVRVQISILAGKHVKNNKRTGPNEGTGRKFL